MRIRRVVTGQQLDGSSVVAADELVESISVSALPGAEFHQLWAADAPTRLPADGTPPPAGGFFPPPQGLRFLTFTVPPHSSERSPVDPASARRELDVRLPGFRAAFEDGAGRHTTDSVDFGVVVAGEVVLELDAGDEVTLRAGDVYVQNGTRHAWRNRTTEPCTIVAVLVGAARRTGTARR